ncbi:hypothetical protein Goshw_002000 [Gossypium schwendimanii]|uniref:Uncharacterized protein n=1 Tax=Gossypium schwendimanii TaxID=34291 RepID=A0A7J9MLE6_GOSSC|nr:hypothetical protein [Gossypium schwendimanii]
MQIVTWLHYVLEVHLLETHLHTEYRWGNLKDSGLIHALEPYPIVLFFCSSCCSCFVRMFEELVFSFSSIVEFEDMQQAALFVVHEALLHAERRGLTVGIFKENIKILGQVLEGKTNIINWKINTLVEDIRRLGNVSIIDDRMGPMKHAYIEVSR